MKGLTADVILLLLSPDSVPAGWRRIEWEPVFFEHPKEAGVELAAVPRRQWEATTTTSFR